uniref:Putative ribonuclease H-like domain-containing protein n=1 Tax=Tanacetum cinerariifolium TaxID=118510 RepID=A0A6L2LZD3_TANCI|nr:putative ribonuclease H-like domain-containing protein [Tanacetum cinerariifolium]
MSKNLEEHGLVGTIIPRTNNKDLQNCLFACFLSQLEPKKVLQALKDPSWIEAMQEELLQFKLQDVWTLVGLPQEKRSIGSKWVFKNKMNKRGIVIRNKARLVAQGDTQEEGIDYDEVFSPVASIEATRLFLAYASFKDFIVYQMDVKSAFLYGKIEKEVYVCQPPRFEDPDFPDKVYKVKKALYSLHQASKSWYETLSTYLLDNGFNRGQIDKTLFIKETKMSSMGKLTFFLGLQVKQKKEGIFISQDKYVAEILKKFRFSDVKKSSTPMETLKPLLKDEDGEEVDTVVANFTTEVEYVAASSCCGQIKTVNDDVRLQALIDKKNVVITEAFIRHDLKLNDAKEGTSCLSNAVIFEELAKIGYEKTSEKLIFYKAFFSPQWKFFIQTILQCLSAKTTSWNEFSSTMVSAIICLANNQKFNFSNYILDNLKKNLEAGVPFYMFPRFIEVFVNNQLGDMSRHKVDDLPTVIQDTPIPDAPSSSQHQRKHKPRIKERKETEVSPTEIHTEDHVPTTSNDPLPSGKDRMKLKELMDLCINLSNKVLDLNNEVIKMESSHKAKIEELESKNVYNLDMAHEETVLSMQDVDVQSERIEDADAKEVAKEMVEVMEIARIIVDEVSTAGGELNAANEKPAKGIVFHDKEESTTRTTSSKSLVKDKGKAKLVEVPEILKSRKAQIAIDEEVVRRIEAEWNADMKDNIDWNEVLEQVQSRQSDAKEFEMKDLGKVKFCLGFQIDHLVGFVLIFRYLHGIKDMGLYYTNQSQRNLVSFADAGYMSDPHMGRSQTGYVFTSSNNVISWRSVKQTMSATSSNHAEILAIHEASRECVIQHICESCGISSGHEAPTVYTKIMQCALLK